MSRTVKALVAALVCVLWFGLGLGPLLSPLLYTLTPLQRYYLGAYIASSRHAEEPQARTGIEWVLRLRDAAAQPAPRTASKSAQKKRAKHPPEPRGELAFAADRDVVPKPLLDTVWNGHALPLRLSEEAAREGWTGLARGYPRQVDSAQLQAMLRQDYFDGESWWSFFVQPALALATLLLLGLIARTWIEGRRERHWWRQPVRKREMLRRWMLKSPRAAALPERAAPLQIEAAVAPSLPPPRPRAADAVPVAAPVPVAAARPPRAVPVWDASQGIE